MIIRPCNKKTLVNTGALQAQVPGLTAVAFGYDARGRLAGIGQGTRTSSLAYDAHGNLASITDALSRTVGFAYDDAGRVRTQTLPDGRQIQYSYDAAGNVTSITPLGRPAHGFTYTPARDEARSHGRRRPGPPEEAGRVRYTFVHDPPRKTRGPPRRPRRLPDERR